MPAAAEPAFGLVFCVLRNEIIATALCTEQQAGRAIRRASHLLAGSDGEEEDRCTGQQSSCPAGASVLIQTNLFF